MDPLDSACRCDRGVTRVSCCGTKRPDCALSFRGRALSSQMAHSTLASKASDPKGNAHVFFVRYLSRVLTTRLVMAQLAPCLEVSHRLDVRPQQHWTIAG